MDTTPDRPATDVRAVAREAWRTRPARRRDDEMIAGVGGAVARRYAVDPTLVRVALVVLAVSGSGLLLYLVGCLVLPADPTDRPRRAGGVRPGGRGAPFLLIVATAVVGLGTLGGWGDGWLATLASVALAGVALYGLQTSRGGEVAAPAPAREPGTAGAPDPAERSGPPAWDPLGAAPFAWDLPTPAPAEPASPRSPFTPVVLGLALLAAGSVGLLSLLGVPGPGATSISATWIWAAALAVVGAGLVVGAFRRRGRWLIAAAIPLALVTLGSAVGPPGPGPMTGASRTESGVGDVVAVPADAAAVAPRLPRGPRRRRPRSPADRRDPGGPGAGDRAVRRRGPDGHRPAHRGRARRLPVGRRRRLVPGPERRRRRARRRRAGRARRAGLRPDRALRRGRRGGDPWLRTAGTRPPPTGRRSTRTPHTPTTSPAPSTGFTGRASTAARGVDVLALVAGVLALLVAGGATVARGVLPAGLPDPRWVLVVVVLLAGAGLVTWAVRRP